MKKPLPVTPSVQQPDVNPEGRPTAEMLLTLPPFITGGYVMFGAPTPILLHAHGDTIHVYPKALKQSDSGLCGKARKS